MKYKICKMHFSTGLHIGNGLLSDGNPVFLADTIFSALCHEALNIENGISKLVKYFREGSLKISDGLPYISEILYVPKPTTAIETENEGNSKEKKAFKKLKYVPVDKLCQFIKGNLDANKEKKILDTLGQYEMVQKASITYEAETVPYYVGIFQYQKNNGIYILIGYDSEEALQYIMLLLKGLSYSGIGGKRKSGYGKFSIEYQELTSEFKKRMELSKYNEFITLSFSLPVEKELEEVCRNSDFQLIKRSGFVSSCDYADTFRKKKDFFGLSAGACVSNVYSGKIYDVSGKGNHPVYEYAIPLFMGVK